MTSSVDSAAPQSRPAQSNGSAVRALRHRNFAVFFSGNLLSNCGTWFQNIALALLVYRLTKSSLWVGVVNFAQFAGVLFLLPWAGSAADRFDRRKLIIATQIGATAASGALAFAVARGSGTLPIVLLLALVLGITTAFSTPAMQAIIPALVPREELGSAIALNSVTFNLARAIGPVAGALVVARMGIAWAIGLNALSYVLFALALLLIRPGEQQRRTDKPKQLQMWDTLHDLKQRQLVTLLITVAAVSLTMDPVSTLTPAFATKLFHHSDTFAGLLIGAFGVGAVAASLIPIRLSKQPGRDIAGMLVIMSGGMIALAVAGVLWLGLAALALAGFGYLAGQTRATTLLQLRIGDQERGRVMALWSPAFLGTRPLGSLADGGLAALLGPRMATVVMALPALGAAVLLLRWRPPSEAEPAAQ